MMMIRLLRILAVALTCCCVVASIDVITNDEIKVILSKDTGLTKINDVALRESTMFNADVTSSDQNLTLTNLYCTYKETVYSNISNISLVYVFVCPGNFLVRTNYTVVNSFVTKTISIESIHRTRFCSGMSVYVTMATSGHSFHPAVSSFQKSLE